MRLKVRSFGNMNVLKAYLLSMPLPALHLEILTFSINDALHTHTYYLCLDFKDYFKN